MPSQQLPSPIDRETRTVVRTDQNYTIDRSDDVVDVIAAGLTVRLPLRPMFGQQHCISATGGSVTLNGNGNPIVGSTTLPQGVAVTLLFAADDTWIPIGDATTSIGYTGTTGSTGSTGSTGQTGVLPAGSGSELQARLNASTFQAVPWSLVSSTEVRGENSLSHFSTKKIGSGYFVVWEAAPPFVAGSTDSLNIGTDATFDPAKTVDELELVSNEYSYWGSADSVKFLQWKTAADATRPANTWSWYGDGPAHINLAGVAFGGVANLTTIFGGGVGVCVLGQPSVLPTAAPVGVHVPILYFNEESAWKNWSVFDVKVTVSPSGNALPANGQKQVIDWITGPGVTSGAVLAQLCITDPGLITADCTFQIEASVLGRETTTGAVASSRILLRGKSVASAITFVGTNTPLETFVQGSDAALSACAVSFNASAGRIAMNVTGVGGTIIAWQGDFRIRVN